MIFEINVHKRSCLNWFRDCASSAMGPGTCSKIVGMVQTIVSRETQRGGAPLSISRHSPLSERLKLVTYIREFKIPRQLWPVTGVHTLYPTPSLPPLPAHTSLRRPYNLNAWNRLRRWKSHLKMTLHSLKLQCLSYSILLEFNSYKNQIQFRNLKICRRIFMFSTETKRETRQFHVEVEQWHERNVPKRARHVLPTKPFLRFRFRRGRDILCSWKTV